MPASTDPAPRTRVTDPAVLAGASPAFAGRTPWRRWLVRIGIAGLFLAAGVFFAVLDFAGILGFGVVLGALLWLLGIGWLAFFLVRGFLRRLLWRVGRRLLVSYLLLGVVPVPFLAAFVYGVAWIGAGHLATWRAEHEIDRASLELRQALLEADAALLRGEAVSPAARREVLAEQALSWPGLILAHRPRGGAAVVAGGDAEGELPAADDLLPAERVHLDLLAVGVLDSVAYLAAVERTDAGVLLGFVPFEPGVRRIVEARTRLTVRFPSADESLGKVTKNTEDVVVERTPADDERETGEEEGSDEGDEERLELPRPPPSGVDGPFGEPVVYWVQSVRLPYVDWRTEDWHAVTEPREEEFPVIVRTSIAREALEILRREEEGAEDGIGDAVLGGLSFLAVAISVIWFTAAVLAGVLVWRIARATSRLEVAFQAVEEGRFEHRARMRGRDQLAELLAGFNRMAAHLERSVEERAEREALERELAVARDLQQSLLPDPGFSYPGLEIATHFAPAQAIGGDFYHFGATEGEGGESRLDVVVGDVSGHGLGTGIVMAVVRTLLSALEAENPPPVDLFERLDREIRASTDARTFVTLVQVRLDLDAGTVGVTNAGHVPPYRVRPDGRVTSPSADARPLGLSLPSEFHTVADDLEPGDLWIVLSDGLVESLDAAGEIFGYGRWERLMASVAGLGAAAARDQILRAWGEFVGAEEPEDDRTLLVVRVGGSDQPDPADPSDAASDATS